MKSNKMPYIAYVDLESLIKIIDRWTHNPEKSYTTKIGEHITCRNSLSTIWAFDNVENKHTLYYGEDCMKKFCFSQIEHVTNVIKFEKKMLPLTNKELKLHHDATTCYILQKKLLKITIIEKLETIVITQVNIDVQHKVVKYAI